LKNPDSLKFIEKNQTMKTLNLSTVQFNIYQMKVLGETLYNNETISSLSLSESNFKGSFQFLKKSNLKTFNFTKIPCEGVQDFIDHFTQNDSIEFLDFSISSFDDDLKISKWMNSLIEILSNHKKMKHISWEMLQSPNENISFHKLYKNPNLEILDLCYFKSKPLNIYLNELDNTSLKELSILNKWTFQGLNEIKNHSIEKLYLRGTL
jgi:hypothetical protein